MIKLIDLQQVPIENRNPLQIYHALAVPGSGSCLIETESVSFIGFDPLYLSVQNFESLKEAMERLAYNDGKLLPRFFGGLIGFMAYDAVRQFERLPHPSRVQESCENYFFQLYRYMLIFDHQNDQLSIVRLSLESHSDLSLEPAPLPFEVGGSLSDETFAEMVSKAKKYLMSGDIFQVVLSRSFEVPFAGEPITLYETLKKINPSPYHYFFSFPDAAIVGASPEKLVSLHQGLMETVPIAGTCLPNEEDEKKLLADPKENAEHMMLVDLARNDLGRVSAVGSVKVRDLKILQKFSHVSHLVSVVQGVLKVGFQALDVLQAVFPGGTLSGAPKIRAMQIIDELENIPRGLYGGALCFFDQQANMDSCLVIRTAVIKDGLALIHAGAGIVLDSDPEHEARETRRKASALMEAIRQTVERIAC